MSDSIREQCNIITQSQNQIFLRKRNVVGMGYGYKIVNGVNTGELCLKIFVAKKESTSSLNEDDIIPKLYNGIKTDVKESGKFTKSTLREKNLPLKFGYSIGPNGVGDAGTAGCLVRDSCFNYYILSNNHVLAEKDKLPIGTPILHPSYIDGGQFPNDVIAHLSKKIPIKKVLESEDPKDYKEEDYNYVDCAIAKVDNPCLVTKKIAFIGGVKGVCDPKLDMKVKKTGSTTGLTKGTITGVDCLIEVESYGKKIELYKNQIITTSMEEEGDSGSLLLDECNNAIGLLFAGSDSDTVFNPIKTVLKVLDVKIVTC